MSKSTNSRIVKNERQNIFFRDYYIHGKKFGYTRCAKIYGMSMNHHSSRTQRKIRSKNLKRLYLSSIFHSIKYTFHSYNKGSRSISCFVFLRCLSYIHSCLYYFFLEFFLDFFFFPVKIHIVLNLFKVTYHYSTCVC